MITEQQLFDLGFRIFGICEEENIDCTNDPYYKLLTKSRNFNIDSLSGNFNNKGEFILFSNNKSYTEISELKTLLVVLGIEIDYDTTNKYGSKKYLRDDDACIDSINEKTLNEFIYELVSYKKSLRVLPVVAYAKNLELHPPNVKIIPKSPILFSEPLKLIITINRNGLDESQSPIITIDTKLCEYPYAIRDSIELALKLDGYTNEHINEVFGRSNADTMKVYNGED